MTSLLPPGAPSAIHMYLFWFMSVLCHNFWTNWGTDTFSNSKWPFEPQLCEGYLCKWWKKWLEMDSSSLKALWFHIMDYGHPRTQWSFLFFIEMHLGYFQQSRIKAIPHKDGGCNYFMSFKILILILINYYLLGFLQAQ